MKMFLNDIQIVESDDVPRGWIGLVSFKADDTTAILDGVIVKNIDEATEPR